MAIDLQSILNDYDDKKYSKSGSSNNNDLDDSDEVRAMKAILQRNIEHADSDEDRLNIISELEKTNSIEYNGKKYESSELQKFISASFTNALNIKNAQKIVIISNRENMRKGMNKEMNAALAKAAGKGQVSTITIPTQLLRYVQQEIGGLDVKITQNDALAGFLYWYFGKPEDISFGSKEAASKINEIVTGLDINASPSKFSKVNYNTSNTLLERIEDLYGKMETVLSLTASLTKDSLESKVKSDKLYIALCYNILNLLAFAPPVMPGEQPEDVDMLAGGSVWDLMSGIDTAYDYFKNKNGREIYKSKVRKKINAFNYTPAQTVQSYDNDNDDYNDFDDFDGDDYMIDNNEYFEDVYRDYQDEMSEYAVSISCDGADENNNEN